MYLARLAILLLACCTTLRESETWLHPPHSQSADATRVDEWPSSEHELPALPERSLSMRASEELCGEFLDCVLPGLEWPGVERDGWIALTPSRADSPRQQLVRRRRLLI